MVVVLDALDEAAEPIEPWSTPIGRGVHVLATCRAEAGERPMARRRWRERATGAGYACRRGPASPLDEGALAAWLTATMARSSPALTLVKAGQRGERRRAAIRRFFDSSMRSKHCGWRKDPFPNSFAGYAHETTGRTASTLRGRDTRLVLGERARSFRAADDRQGAAPASWINGVSPERGWTCSISASIVAVATAEGVKLLAHPRLPLSLRRSCRISMWTCSRWRTG